MIIKGKLKKPINIVNTEIISIPFLKSYNINKANTIGYNNNSTYSYYLKLINKHNFNFLIKLKKQINNLN